MMTYRMTRRIMLCAAAAVAALTGSGMAQPGDIRGAVSYEGGAAIPEGLLRIGFEDPALPDNGRQSATRVHVKSDGSARTIAFSVAAPPQLTAASPTLQIVAWLERADGWLLARGTAQMDDGVPVSITLNTVMY